MNCLVTGCAGFIGSHLAERLLADGHDVVGIDAFLDYYPRPIKERNLAPLKASPRFRFVEGDLARLDLTGLVAGVERVFHQAAQAGVRASWGKEFDVYVQANVLGTQRLLEAARDGGVGKVVYASSSSVYGEVDVLPMREDSLPRPHSPYGVTKLAGEHLCGLYARNFGLPTVALRYFTVYGPRQRPDMAFHRFLKAAFLDEEIVLYDDGEQSRDFTFVRDAVEANVAAALREEAHGVYNVGGGSRVSLLEVFDAIGEIAGRPLRIRREPRQQGDVRHTAADVSRAAADLGFAPEVGLREGLEREWVWIQSVYGSA